MRAIYLEDLNSSEEILSTEKSHHLINVLRMKEEDEILILDGRGKSRLAKISFITKKDIKLINTSLEFYSQKEDLKIAICTPKKEALSLCLKQAVEIGCSEILLIDSEFSQRNQLSVNRLDAIIISALEQSNNKWLPIIKQMTLSELIKIYQNSLLYLTTSDAHLKVKINKQMILLIGPEGGFSLAEEKELKSFKIPALHFKTPIMRAPTALSFGLGFVFSHKFFIEE